MFTGIIEKQAEILERTDQKLVLARPQEFTDIAIGSSIAVNGVCLTIVALTKSSMTFDVVPETVTKTTLGSLETGDSVNLERALQVGERIDGHIVQGHVEGVGILREDKTMDDGSREIVVDVPAEILSTIVPKGSIALDGVSLTVAEKRDDGVRIALIPETLRSTTFGNRKVGERINIETDILSKSARS